jgi:hypothetical protein
MVSNELAACGGYIPKVMIADISQIWSGFVNPTSCQNENVATKVDFNQEHLRWRNITVI